VGANTITVAEFNVKACTYSTESNPIMGLWVQLLWVQTLLLLLNLTWRFVPIVQEAIQWLPWQHP